MRAMVLRRQGERIAMERRRRPRPGPGELALEVAACVICRTDLHIVDGELGEPELPLILGHQIVGHVVERGSDVEAFEAGDRVGVPWPGWRWRVPLLPLGAPEVRQPERCECAERVPAQCEGTESPPTQRRHRHARARECGRRRRQAAQLSASFAASPATIASCERMTTPAATEAARQ